MVESQHSLEEEEGDIVSELLSSRDHRQNTNMSRCRLGATLETFGGQKYSSNERISLVVEPLLQAPIVSNYYSN